MQRFEHVAPADIERRSMQIIDEELSARGLGLDPATIAVVKRAIHTTADFDYAKSLVFLPATTPSRPDASPDRDPVCAPGGAPASAVGRDAGCEGPLRARPDAASAACCIAAAHAALRGGATIVCDTNMALAGISKPALSQLGCTAICHMADPDVAATARATGTTRAVASIDKVARESTANASPLVLVVGNAPTALVRICELMGEGGLAPSLVVGVPVGFVNVVAAKELLIETCTAQGVPAIVARGRKGGSNVAAAIVNALLYEVCGRTA